jgi:valyl-tRNA synthetase
MTDRPDGKPGLAQMTMDAVTDGRVKFFPERYARTYLDWLGEKRDWCVSRQLWWGHRIPVWRISLPVPELQQQLRELDAILEKVSEIGDPQGQLPEMRRQRESLVADTFRAESEYLRKYGDVVATQYGFNEESGEALLFVAVQDGHEAIEKDLERLKFTQEEDVLDTWFSSALWPHSTLGWPEPTAELAYYYPTSVLVTNRDIITLWVARMVMTGLYNVGKVPFHHTYIHPKILDGFGEGMSKMKGNGVDPMDVIDLYGADALRFGMAFTATETQDTRMPVTNVCPHCGHSNPVKQEHMYLRTKKLTCPECKKPFRPGGPWPADDPELPTAKQGSEKFDQGRNFANKLWNAARYVLGNLQGYTPGAVEVEKLPIEDRWILSRLATTAAQVTRLLECYQFSEAIRAIYEFTWSEFCDWYLEMAKSRMRADDKATVQRVLAGVLDGILRLVQPFMPFVAESLWQALGESAFERGLPPQPATESVVIAPWPSYPESWRDEAMESRLHRMQDLVKLVREIRNRYTVEPKKTVDVAVKCQGAIAEDFRVLAPFITQLATVGELECGPGVAKPRQAATQVHADFELYVSLAGLIDVAAEVARQEKQRQQKEKSLQAAKAKLSNAGFLERASPEVVQQTRDQVADLEAQLKAIDETLRDLRQG